MLERLIGDKFLGHFVLASATVPPCQSTLQATGRRARWVQCALRARTGDSYRTRRRASGADDSGPHVPADVSL